MIRGVVDAFICPYWEADMLKTHSMSETNRFSLTECEDGGLLLNTPLGSTPLTRHEFTYLAGRATGLTFLIAFSGLPNVAEPDGKVPPVPAGKPGKKSSNNPNHH